MPWQSAMRSFAALRTTRRSIPLLDRRQDLAADLAVGILHRHDIDVPPAGKDFGRLLLGEGHTVPDPAVVVVDGDVDRSDLVGVFAGPGRAVQVAHGDRPAQAD